MSNEAVLTSEQRVRRAVPGAFATKCLNWNGWHVYASTSDSEGLSDVKRCREFLTAEEAWDNATKHPTVVAFESQHRSAGESEGKPTPFPRPSDRDWTEDAPHENGNYSCLCVTCKQTFIGHKRRVQCRVCASKPVAPASGKGMSAKEFLASKGYAEPEGVFPISIAGLLEEFAALSAAPAPEVNQKHNAYVTLNQREQCARAECSCGWIVQYAPYSPRSLAMAEEACNQHIRRPNKATDPVISNEDVDAFIAEEKLQNKKP